MEDQLAGQVAVVTGATKGIGRATAMALASAGAKVVILARTEKDVQATAREIRCRGAIALPLATDVTDSQDVERAFQTILGEVAVIDILVNNAGVGIRKPFQDMTPAEWDSLIDVNVKGVFHCTRAALQHMHPRQRGCIINIASRAGRQAEPNLAVYSATKAAAVAFSRTLAHEVRMSGIRVVTICPGPVDTERIRRLRPSADRTSWLRPMDVAQAVVFLASPLAQAYNGAVLDLFV